MIHELLASRRSVRRFRDEMPSREVIETIVRAAGRAPSASNQQPWRFLAVTDRSLIAALANEVRAAVSRVASAVEPELDEPLRRYGEYFVRFEGAPIVLVVLWRPMRVLSHLAKSGADRSCMDRIHELEEGSGLVSSSLALGNLLLAAHEAGLGACCMTGPLLAAEETRALLSIPSSWRVTAFVPLGFPAEEPPPTPRKPLERILTWI